METTLDGIAASAQALMAELAAEGHPQPATLDALMRTEPTTLAALRGTFLYMQLRAVGAYASQLAQRKAAAADGQVTTAPLPFDQESQLLYGARAPTYTDAHYEQILADLEGLLPGTGALVERYAAYKAGFVIPPDRLDAVFRTAVEETRRRTLEHIQVRGAQAGQGTGEGPIKQSSQRARVP